MDLNTITVTDFKSLFTRDFQYAPEGADLSQKSTYVFDSDITKAFQEAKMIFNQSLFGSNENITTAYLYLTAHYVVNDLRTAFASGNNGGSFPVSSRSVGSVSESYAVPAMFTNNPSLMLYNTTGYGNKYLSFLLPNLVGNVGVVCGNTRP